MGLKNNSEISLRDVALKFSPNGEYNRNSEVMLNFDFSGLFLKDS